MMTKEELEKAMAQNILDSLDIKKTPEFNWTYGPEKNTSSTYEIFERKDGLKLRVKEGGGMAYFYLISPVDYGRFEYNLERTIMYAISQFKIYIQELEKKRKEEAKAKILIDFFGLDIKKQRKDKIEKINESEQS